jgi:diadenosine tetraphosphatase ApaH/serine/threonine PP2A family protein phosphatase
VFGQCEQKSRFLDSAGASALADDPAALEMTILNGCHHGDLSLFLSSSLEQVPLLRRRIFAVAEKILRD